MNSRLRIRDWCSQNNFFKMRDFESSIGFSKLFIDDLTFGGLLFYLI